MEDVLYRFRQLVHRMDDHELSGSFIHIGSGFYVLLESYGDIGTGLFIVQVCGGVRHVDIRFFRCVRGAAGTRFRLSVPEEEDIPHLVSTLQWLWLYLQLMRRQECGI